MIRRNLTDTVEHVTHRRKVLKRPKRFKNYYTDREPLSISCFEFPRLGDQLLFRGRQTLCKYYNNNEIINDRLIEIKSAVTIKDFEKILNNQFQNKQAYFRAVEPYYDTSSILASSLKPLANETCLCTKDYYRLNYYFEEKRKQQCTSPLLSKTTSNAIKTFTVGNSSIDNFICLASECYDNCIQNYLNNLNDCNQKVEKSIKGQSSTEDHTAIGVNDSKPSLSLEHSSYGSDKINENILTNHLNKLNINLHTNCDVTPTFDTRNHSKSTGQSIPKHPKCRSQAMSCSDTNNNNSESTNHIKDPPKIIFSDFSTVKQPKQDTSDKNLSDNRSAIDSKNCLTIPIATYCSELRPP
ncbi:uncharacterized protein [Chironomus tepperi]